MPCADAGTAPANAANTTAADRRPGARRALRDIDTSAVVAPPGLAVGLARKAARYGLRSQADSPRTAFGSPVAAGIGPVAFGVDGAGRYRIGPMRRPRQAVATGPVVRARRAAGGAVDTAAWRRTIAADQG